MQQYRNEDGRCWFKKLRPCLTSVGKGIRYTSTGGNTQAQNFISLLDLGLPGRRGSIGLDPKRGNVRFLWLKG